MGTELNNLRTNPFPRPSRKPLNILFFAGKSFIWLKYSRDSIKTAKTESERTLFVLILQITLRKPQPLMLIENFAMAFSSTSVTVSSITLSRQLCLFLLYFHWLSHPTSLNTSLIILYCLLWFYRRLLPANTTRDTFWHGPGKERK